jgi:hypothetical protein
MNMNPDPWAPLRVAIYFGAAWYAIPVVIALSHLL